MVRVRHMWLSWECVSCIFSCVVFHLAQPVCVYLQEVQGSKEMFSHVISRDMTHSCQPALVQFDRQLNIGMFCFYFCLKACMHLCTFIMYFSTTFQRQQPSLGSAAQRPVSKILCNHNSCLSCLSKCMLFF